MNILPQKYSEFKSKDYWNTFFESFKNTQNQFFEWYGNYQDFKTIFHSKPNNKSNFSLIQPKQFILHVGCGKSTFGEDLYKQYKANQGYELSIVNCDYSEIIIKSMHDRLIQLQDPVITQQDKKNISYIVCDLLQPFKSENQQYSQFLSNFDTIIDKGTLDAMLPQDNIENIDKIKQLYFRNMELCLRKQSKGKFIIVSMLQQFVIRTLLEYFYSEQTDKNNDSKSLSEYQIKIYECIIKDSKMQPFLVLLEKSPLKQANSQKCIQFFPLDEKKPKKLKTALEVMKIISETQLRTQYSHKIKSLIPGQRTKYNIFNQNNNNKLRYLIEVFDSENKNIMNKNTCSVMIVPQGKENSYTYNDYEGIKYLAQEIGSSRLLLTKLMPGNKFKSIEQVKQELNNILPDLIQSGCKVKEVPYLTDGDQLGKNYSLIQNNQFIIDEVLVQGQPYRRFILKSNINYTQCRFKLCLTGANNIYAEYSKKANSNILPKKKNMVTGIDRQVLADDNAQIIYSGITGLLGQIRLNKGARILLIGEQLALVKYLLDHFQGVQITLLTKCETIKQVLPTYMQIIDEERLEIVLIKQSMLEFLNKNIQQKYDIIIMTENQKSSIPNPPSEIFKEQIVSSLREHISYPGLFICQYWNYKLEKITSEIIENLVPFFFPLYSYPTSSQQSQDSNIIFALQYKPQYKDQTIIIHQKLLKPLNKNSNNMRNDWENQWFKQLQFIDPMKLENKQTKNYIIIDKESKFEDIYQLSSQQKSKKKKNKKKK